MVEVLGIGIFKDSASPLESFKEELKADHDNTHMTVSFIGEGDPDHVDKKPLASDAESNLQYTDEEVPTNAASTDEPSKTTSNSMASSEASSDHMLSLDAIPTTDAVLTSSSGCTNDDTFMTSKSHTRPDSEAAVLSSSVAKSEVVTAQPSIKDNENDSAEVTTPTVALPPVDPIGVATSTQEDISLSKPTDQHMLPSTDREDVMSVKSHQFGSDTGLVKSILADASSQTITPQSAQPAISSFLSSTSGPDSQDPKVAIEEKVMGHHTSSQIKLVDNIPKEPQTITAEPTASSTPLATDDTAKAPTTFTAELINPPSPPSTNDRPNEPTTSVISPQLDTAPVDTDASQPVNDTPSKDLPAAFVNRTRSVSKGFFKSLNHRKEGSKTPDKSKTLTPSATIAEEITEEKASIVKSTLMKKRSLSGLKQKAVSTWNGRHSNQLLHLKEPLPDLSKIQDVVNNQTNEAISSPEQVGETQEQTPAQQQPPTQDQGSEVVQETLNEKKGNDECKGEEVITRVVSRNTEVNSNSNSGVGLSPMKLFKRTMLHKRTETQTTLTKTSTQPNPAPSPPSTPKTQPTWRLMNNHFSKASTTTNTNTSTPQELNSGGIGYSPSASQTLKKQPTRTKTLNESSEKKVGSKDHYRFSGFFSKIFR